jgi:hypothetical protein
MPALHAHKESSGGKRGRMYKLHHTPSAFTSADPKPPSLSTILSPSVSTMLSEACAARQNPSPYCVEDREEERAAGINRQRHQPSDGTGHIGGNAVHS